MIMTYRGFSLLVFIVFVIYVFDIRHKKGMETLIAPVWTVIMKLFSVAMLGLYAYLLATTEVIRWNDVVALCVTTLGTSLVVAGKVTLGRYHTWVGYHLPQTTIVCHGIYSRLRHPLYTGLILFEIGAFFVIFTRLSSYPDWATWAVAATFAYMILFNIYLATLESAAMKRKFGAEFDRYKARVRAFIPINKFTGPMGS